MCTTCIYYNTLDDLMEHYECVTQEYFQLTSFSTSSIFQLGTLQSYKWENLKDDPVWNTARTFFGNISSVPKVFLMGTPWLHNQDHLKCTGNSLPLENLQCSCSVRSGNTAITLSIYLQCTCSVPAPDTGSCPQCNLPAGLCQGHSHPKLSAPLRGSNHPLLASTELAW